MPHTLPGNWYEVLVPWGHHRRIKVHPDKNAHRREKAEGLFKQIGKAKDGVLYTEARRRHDADIQRGTRRQREVH